MLTPEQVFDSPEGGAGSCGSQFPFLLVQLAQLEQCARVERVKTDSYRGSRRQSHRQQVG